MACTSGLHFHRTTSTKAFTQGLPYNFHWAQHWTPYIWPYRVLDKSCFNLVRRVSQLKLHQAYLHPNWDCIISTETASGLPASQLRLHQAYLHISTETASGLPTSQLRLHHPNWDCIRLTYIPTETASSQLRLHQAYLHIPTETASSQLRLHQAYLHPNWNCIILTETASGLSTSQLRLCWLTYTTPQWPPLAAPPGYMRARPLQASKHTVMQSDFLCQLLSTHCKTMLCHQLAE